MARGLSSIELEEGARVGTGRPFRVTEACISCQRILLWSNQPRRGTSPGLSTCNALRLWPALAPVGAEEVLFTHLRYYSRLRSSAFSRWAIIPERRMTASI